MAGSGSPGVLNMTQLDPTDRIYIAASFIIQTTLVAFFALRLWNFSFALKVGWIVYALAVPAVVVSVMLIRAGKAWYLAAAGFLYGAWCVFGAIVDIFRPVEWRNPILWPIFLPYVILYLSGIMFYWWPLARIHRPSWFIYAVLFILSTLLNLAAH